MHTSCLLIPLVASHPRPGGPRNSSALVPGKRAPPGGAKDGPGGPTGPVSFHPAPGAAGRPPFEVWRSRRDSPVATSRSSSRHTRPPGLAESSEPGRHSEAPPAGRPACPAGGAISRGADGMLMAGLPTCSHWGASEGTPVCAHVDACQAPDDGRADAGGDDTPSSPPPGRNARPRSAASTSARVKECVRQPPSTESACHSPRHLHQAPRHRCHTLSSRTAPRRSRVAVSSAGSGPQTAAVPWQAGASNTPCGPVAMGCFGTQHGNSERDKCLGKHATPGR